MLKTSTIIWDWNGTLLDDVEICVESINILLGKRNLPLVDLERYREVFTFPVKDYYENIGFDFDVELYDAVAFEFIDIYLERLQDASLFSQATAMLRYFHNKGFQQAVLSAMEQENLEISIRAKGIEQYFEMIVGMKDHFAVGKAGNAGKIIQQLGVLPEETIFIGDTLHDYEVAQEVKCRSILVAGGHQSLKRLKRSYSMVVAELGDLRGYFH